MLVFGVALFVFLALVCWILLRAFLFRPLDDEAVSVKEFSVDELRVAESLSQMLRCKTVSSRTKGSHDQKEFDQFKTLLKKRYPLVHKHCNCEQHGKNGLLYCWKGQASDAATVLMSHYDVVPAEASQWNKPPFDGIIDDGIIWGRGALDNKATLCGIMEAVEQSLAEGFVPQHDVYLSFGGDEEISGDDAPAVVSVLEQRGIHPALVLDEGGAVISNVFPGVTAPCAIIGTGEKGFVNIELSMISQGGHSSAPPPHSLVGSLAKAAVRLEANPFKARLPQPSKDMFLTLGRHSSFVYRILFANLWLFWPVLDLLCKKTGGELNALVRTTLALTMMEASNAPNVLAPRACMVANLRLISGDTIESALKRVQKLVKNEAITVKQLEGNEASPFSCTDSEGWKRVKDSIRQTWPEALVSPFLMIAASDARHFCRISDNVFRFSVMELTREERNSIHGHNERIPVANLAKIVQFYTRLIRAS